MADPDGVDERVLLLSPTTKDGQTGCRLLADAGLRGHLCGSVAEVCAAVAAGAGAVIVPAEALLDGGRDRLAAALRQQPPWSNLPVLVLMSAGRMPGHRVQTLLDIGDVTLLKRPLEPAEFVAAVHAALRDRRRQYLVRDHMAEQARQAEDLRAADRRKDEFLAMLAHELRNPLAPIRNGLQILKMAADKPAAVAKTRDMMDRQVQHLSRLVDDLLDVSRITRGKAELRKGQVDLTAALGRAVETVRPLIEERRHKLIVTQPGRPVWVWADATRITQVVGNLLTNAAKYTEEGGRITLALEEPNGDAVIRVTDTGTGIPADMLPKVFELFTQVDRTLDRSQGGLGIGLTLVKSLVEMHDGTVAAHSGGVGKGSEFVVRLPKMPADQVALSRPKNGTDFADGPRHRILVVDDNVDAGESLGQLLQFSGHQVVVAHSGPKAIEVSRAFQPRVALLDIGLPGMDGYELARSLRAEPFGPELLLIALTGYGQDEDRRRTREAGFDHHLTKPADPKVLVKILAGKTSY
jgi:signal transduction histidine kinase